MEKKKTWRINAAYTVFQEKNSTVSKSSLYLQSYPPCIIWNKRNGSSIRLPVYSSPFPNDIQALQHAPRTAVSNGIHLNPALVTKEQLRFVPVSCQMASAQR